MTLWGLFWAILIIGSFVSYALSINNQNARKKIGQQTEFLLHELDEKYEDYINKYLTVSVLKSQNIEIEKIVQNVFTILKPDIDGLLAFIQASNFSNVPVNHTSKHFKGLASLAAAYFKKTGNNRLDHTDEENFRNAFRDALIAEVNKKILDLKAGNYLE